MDLRASVLIPVYNRIEELEFLLYSISQQASEAILEVIVCDDGSDLDITPVIEKSPIKSKIKYFRQDRDGFRAGKARNLGIFNAQGDVLILVDGDMILDRDLVNVHMGIHNRSKDDVLVIGCRHVFHNLKLERACMSGGIDIVTDALQRHLRREDERIGILKRESIKDVNEFAYPFMMSLSCHLSIKRKLLMGIGGFNESFTGYGWEDTELGYRLYKRGIRFLFEPKAICYHKHHDYDPETNVTLAANALQFYRMYKTNEVAECLILLGMKPVYEEYKEDLDERIKYPEQKRALLDRADFLLKRSKTFWFAEKICG